MEEEAETNCIALFREETNASQKRRSVLCGQYVQVKDG
jgi:hypothetical protein